MSVTTVFPGEIATALHDHEKATMPDWYHGGDAAAGVDRLAAAILRGVERDRRAVHHPPIVRLLGLNGLAPRATDRDPAPPARRHRRATSRLTG